ncbi:cytochrome C oxidase subunit IV family protein [Aquisphaera insulae]|uniref:cytochrome C oxidase subunit IV family protein n=1 Tax=Aquisphaera insulae TaxID=2712864 RepID=UPI0013ED9849|nr:cytochrome C oxidase subunit IV family protein [Aquisphaera insulae]
MADPQSLTPEMADELQVESHAPYFRVWLALAVLTFVEYVYAMIVKDHFALLLLGLLSMALVKAGLVGWYFMHLKFEKKWVYLMIIPACVLAVFLTIMLCPDVALKPVAEDLLDEGETMNVPAPAIDHPGTFRIVA